MIKKIVMTTILSILPAAALADSHCTYSVYREGGDPAKSNVKTSIQNGLKAHTLAEKGALDANLTLDDCLKKASDLLSSHRELNDKNKHEYPTIIVTFSSETEKVKVSIKQIDKKEKKEKKS